MSEDNSGRNKQEESSKQADGDQAAYLDSLIAQFMDDVDVDFASNADEPHPSASDEPERIEQVMPEPDESPSQVTTPVEVGKPEKPTDPTIVMLASFVIVIVLSIVLWLAFNDGDDDKHAVTDIGQPVSQNAPAQTAMQPATHAAMDQPTASENNAAPAAKPDQGVEPAAAPDQSEEPAAVPDQTEESAAAPEQTEEPAAVPNQSEPSAPAAEQQQAQTPTQTALPTATMQHLYIDPVSRKVIAPKPASTDRSWAVNLTSVSTLAAAENIRQSLDSRGITTELILVTIGNKSFYRIRIPGLANKRAARQALRTYRKEREFRGAWIDNYHPLPKPSE